MRTTLPIRMIMVVLEMAMAKNAGNDASFDIVDEEDSGVAWTEPTLIFFTNVAPVAPSLYSRGIFHRCHSPPPPRGRTSKGTIGSPP